MEIAKAFLLGLFCGALVSSVVVWRTKPKEKIFITPNEISGGQIKNYKLPKEVACCIKLIVNKEGKFDLQHYGRE